MFGVSIDEVWQQPSLIQAPPSTTKKSKYTVPIEQNSNYNPNPIHYNVNQLASLSHSSPPYQYASPTEYSPPAYSSPSPYIPTATLPYSQQTSTMIRENLNEGVVYNGNNYNSLYSSNPNSMYNYPLPYSQQQPQYQSEPQQSQQPQPQQSQPQQSQPQQPQQPQSQPPNLPDSSTIDIYQIQKDFVYLKTIIQQLKKELIDTRQQLHQRHNDKNILHILLICCGFIILILILIFVIQIVQKINKLMNQPLMV